MHITILVPGFGYPSPAICPYEVFSGAGVLWQQLMGNDSEKPPFDVIFASDEGEPVNFSGGVSIQPAKAVLDIENTDLIFVPSIGLDLEQVFNSNANSLLFLREQAARGKWIAGVCTGVAMLAEAGLLDHRSATTHWALSDKYRQRYPDVEWRTDLFITESDNIFCGGGVYAALDLCLHLVERFAGYEIAKQCSRALLIDAPRTWQASFAVPLVNQQHHDRQVRRAEEYLQKYFNAGFAMSDLASRVGMSSRNFSRRFKDATGETPLNYRHKLRINCAKQLLETDYKSIQEICFEVGYEDVPFFRRIFKRLTGLSPKEYQQRFGSRLASN